MGGGAGCSGLGVSAFQQEVSGPGGLSRQGRPAWCRGLDLLTRLPSSPPQCKKKHTLLCPDFSRRGVCPRGAQCQLLHRNQKRPGRRAASAPAPEPSSASPKSKAASSHGPR